MNVLITGGAGFIGSHLAERCLREGWRVSVLDDLSSGSEDNIAHLKAVQAFGFTIGSVLDARLVRELVDCADLVFHLAAAVGVRRIVESPLRTIETNVLGTELVLNAAAAGRKHIVLASTSEVYGKSDKVPFSEDSDLALGPPTKGRWSYACSKALDEFLGLAYYRERHVPVTIARLFNTVGARQTDRFGMVLPTFVLQARSNAPITVYGDGTQRRCFTDVLDTVEAFIRLARCEAAIGEIVNVGNDREIAIADLATLVRARLRSESEIVYIPFADAYGSQFEDMSRRVPSLEKLERLTGYRPRTALEAMVDAVAGSPCMRSPHCAGSDATVEAGHPGVM